MTVRTAETICDDNGFEIYVDYDYDTGVEGKVFIDFNEVRLVMGGGHHIDIFPLLHPADKDFIISKLSYES